MKSRQISSAKIDMKSKDLLLAFVVSGLSTLLVVCLYLLYLFLPLFHRQSSREPETGGIVMVSGGISSSGFTLLILFQVVLFFTVLAIQRLKRTRA